jgi:acetyl esterase
MAQLYVRPDVQMVLDLLAAAGQPPMSAQSPKDARAAYMAAITMLDPPAVSLVRIENGACPGPAGDIAFRLYDDGSAIDAPRPLISFFHGGGYTIGDLETHHSFCAFLAKKSGWPVVAVDYRLAPEHPFPAAADDCEAATRWLADNASSLGLTISGLIPLGDSAGGNLAIVVTQALMAAPAALPVIAQVPIYPATQADASGGSMDEFAEGFFLTRDSMDYFNHHNAADPTDPRASPLLGQHAGTPPSLVVTAGLDPLRDQGRAYAAALIHAGCAVTYMEMAGSIHGFVHTRQAIPSAQADCERIVAQLRHMVAQL